MALYLDSALVDEARQASTWGFVAGITTNPTLLAQVGAQDPAVREQHVAELCRALRGPVFVQLTGTTFDELQAEARALYALSPSQIHLKVPCTLQGLRLVSTLAAHIPCAVTALFSPAQAWLAAQAGARYVIPYVNRSTRLLGDGPALVRSMAQVLHGTATSILAASLKSPEEAAAAVAAGAQHLTAPFAVIQAMADHALTRQALDEFAGHR